jgi:ribosomal protein S18 acetylase RimI-like enzyme
MEDLCIQQLEARDAYFLSEVARSAYADHYLDLWYDQGDWYMQASFSPETLAVELSDPNTLFYLARYSGLPVGFLKLNIDASLKGYEHQRGLELERIYLNKQATGKGIGSALVDLAVRIAKEKDKEMIWLKAMDTSYGPIAFYKKMGFRISGTYRLKHSLMKEELRGMVIMTRELDNNSNF